MLPRSGHVRPLFMRRRSSASSGKCDSGDEEPAINHCDFYLDDKLPEEYVKQDLVKLAHELHIPGWSSVTQEMAEDITLVRITGALTNSVYSVKPPSYVKENIKREYAGRPYHHRIPLQLLLRVYGPQVDLLIDREKELATVALLTRNKIGPRLFGTFTNGRIEQFLNALRLNPEDLHNPEISRLIAKRMRELHDNISITPDQRARGPVSWRTINKWEIVARSRLADLEQAFPGKMETVFHGTPDAFFAAVHELRQFIEAKYAPEEINKNLVFAHNDTQYGNILRVEPPKGSPLIQPQNEHRQLVVIDFEYSGPNPRAYDIANHFCEWMGDYHHPTVPHHIWLERYPTKEQQMNFINSYVEHGCAEFDEAKLDAEEEDLYEQVAYWKPVVSVHWALWGIIQAVLPVAEGGAADPAPCCRGPYDITSSSPPNQSEIVDEVDEFDCLAYSAEKIALFWADIRALGVCK